MKKLFMLIAALLAVCSQFTSYGQLTPVPAWEEPKEVFGSINDAPQAMPLSPLALFRYALESTERSWVSVNDDKVLQGPGSQPWYSQQQTAEVRNRESLLALGSGKLEFDTADFNYGSASLFGTLETSDGYPNFWGDGWISWYYNEEGRPVSESHLNFTMNEFLKVPSYGAVRARIVVWDDWGNRQTYYLYAENGFFYYPSHYVQHARRGDQLILTFSNGEAAYDIYHGGERRDTVHVRGAIQAGMSGSVSVTNRADIVIDDDQLWGNINPFVDVSFTSDARGEIALSAKIPKNQWLNRFGEEWATSVTIQFTSDGYEAEVRLDPVTHDFWYDFEGERVLLQYHFGQSDFGVKKQAPPEQPTKG